MPGPSQDTVEHPLGQSPGVGVLEADVVAIQQDWLVIDPVLCPVGKPVMGFH